MAIDSGTIIVGGLTISFDTKNAVQIFTANRMLWSGSVGQLHAMCESHQLLKDSANKIVQSTVVSVGNTSNKPVLIDDAVELRNGIISISEALQRAD